MPLDVAMLDVDGRPESWIDLGPQVHEGLMNHADRLGCTLLSRMRDYYRDVDYAVQEVPGVVEELRRIEEVVRERDALSIQVARLIELAQSAAAKGKGLAVISD